MGRHAALASVVVSVLVLMGSGSASAIEPAATFNVTRFDDPPGGSCTVGDCSLRQAIAAVNPRHASDTIEIPAGTIVLDPALASLSITRGDITIEGAGPRSTAISGADGTRVLSLSFSTNSAPVTVRKLSVVHGHVNAAGAGIAVNPGRLNLDQVALTDNHGLADGGGLAVDTGAQVTVARSTIARNSANGNGGGIRVAGTSGAAGGGSAVTVTDSTITSNSAMLGGGLLVAAGDSNSHPAAALTNVTLSGNDANAGGDLERFDAPGGSQSGALSVADTIIAAAARGGNCDGGMTDAGNNIDSAGDCGLIPAGTSLIAVDPLIGPLADNGGPTDTHLLQPGSPAIEGGAACATTHDQRGVNRADDAHHTGVGCDIGAYEAIQTTDLAITNSGSPNPVAAGSTVTYTLTVASPALSPAEPNEAAQPVVQDTLPLGTALVSATPTQGTCNGTATVTCALGHLADGASAQITLVVKTGDGGTISDTATVSSPRIDSNPADDSATAATTVTPPNNTTGNQEPGVGNQQPGAGNQQPGMGNQQPVIDLSIPPAFTGRLSLKPSSFPAANAGPSAARATGTTVRYTLTEPASVTFTVQQQRPGRKVGKRCAKPTKTNSNKRKCTRPVTLQGSFRRASALGRNSFHFTGRLAGKKLKPGHYKLVGTATNSAGKRSKALAASFRIKK
jgi:uncharacterized repeat protein (TIGR01451 family)/CSLREA domain-containing protein